MLFVSRKTTPNSTLSHTQHNKQHTINFNFDLFFLSPHLNFTPKLIPNPNFYSPPNFCTLKLHTSYHFILFYIWIGSVFFCTHRFILELMATVTKDTAPPPSQEQQVGPAPPLTAAEEASKRNTDCVYFLASPLTCKKGSECEYRHSDYARMNPRDCWYWLNGNCLNSKCSFRHPPLEGLVPPQGGHFAGPAPRVPARLAVPSAPQNVAKQAVPCVFFQQGYCLKGDMCPFLHGPVPPPANRMQHTRATTAVAEAPVVLKKAFGGPEICTQTKMTFQASAPKAGEDQQQTPVNAAPKVEVARPFDKVAAGKRYQPPNGVIEEAQKYKETRAPVENGNLRSRTTRVHHASSTEELNYQNGRDADESLRESSPGFDVLVDDKLNDDEYYPNEDQYMRMGGHDRRNLNEFDTGHRDDYNSVADIDTEMYHNRRGYDSYDRPREKYDRKPHGASSERILGERGHYDRRGSYKSRSPDVAKNSDLRMRLSKQREGTGLRSAVNPDFQSDDRGYRSSRRDTRHSPVRENSLGSRLQGRVKLPGRSPPLGGSPYLGREIERGRSGGRLSPSRTPAFSQVRLRDRLSGRIQDESGNGRNFRGSIRNDSIQPNGASFAGPKSLSELRGTKQSDNRQQFSRSEQPVSVGKLRDTVLPGSLGTETNISFDGPKPLSEILKRKRDGGMAASTGSVNSDNKDFSTQKEDVNLISSSTNSAADTRKQVSAPALSQADAEQNIQPLAVDGEEEEGEIPDKKIRLIEDETSIPNNENDSENVEGVIVGDEEEPDVGDGDEHEVDEEYDQGDGGYEYEQDDGEGYNLNENETAEHEDEYMDEDDADDDFAKKLGVSF